MKNMQLIEMNSISSPDMELNVPHELVLASPEDDSKVIIQVKKVWESMQINPQSVLAGLQKHFDEIDRDAADSPNTVCRKGCCGCCSNDLVISISEYFMILRFLNIRYGEAYVQKVSKKARISVHENNCIFVNCTDGSCSIYEVRPLICRKYGLYRQAGGCSRLDSEKDMLPFTRDTSENTLFFHRSDFPKRAYSCPAHTIVYWFSKLQDGKPISEKMRKLFYKSFSGTVDEFIQILV